MSEGWLVRVLRRVGRLRARLQRDLERGSMLLAFSIPSLDRGALAESLYGRLGRPLPSESMTEWWREFDRAVHRRDWRRARRLASLLAAEWDAVRGFTVAFVGVDTDAAMRELDALLAALLGALGSRTVRLEVVESVVSRLRERLP